LKILLSICLFSILLFAQININSIKADFIQTITNDQNKTIKYSGKLFAKKNGFVLWIYQKPIHKKLYFLKNKIIIIEPDLEQAIFAKTDKIPKILNIIQNIKNTDSHIIIKYHGIHYKVSIKNNKILSINYIDRIGNKVKIIFKNEDVNLIIDNSIFQYNIPKDYDILIN